MIIKNWFPFSIKLNKIWFSASVLRLYDTMLNFVKILLENERGPMNDQDLTKADYDPDRSLVLIEGLSHFLTNFLQNLASCQTSFRVRNKAPKTVKQSIGCSLKFPVKDGAEESIVNAPLVSLQIKNTNNAKSEVRFK
jgi:hypothetical protein